MSDTASLRRLKQRIARSSYVFHRMTDGRMRREINAIIDQWADAEHRRRSRTIEEPET